ncbi:uncharacterized protein LOC129588859 isoform X2 [Paramacrobiotus metropolitanus]|uniref:uncharacterized protein LOC129588859 isoform X2 n=1 Tax=Paramacrobiotus metropolitanus TaxID=2943436 RepID=UPI0024458990|nr:uncharacterized protein LOC129588859 isoform X2 [Paramacrobiotus metropolitanus]
MVTDFSRRRASQAKYPLWHHRKYSDEIPKKRRRRHLPHPCPVIREILRGRVPAVWRTAPVSAARSPGIVILLAAAAMSACWKRGTICLSPTCLGWLMLLLLPQLHLSAGCSPQQLAPANLSDMLADALLNNRQDDRIILTGLVPSDIPPDSVVSRPRLGEDATFICNVPASVDWRHVAWLHQDWPVYEAEEPQALRDGDTTGQTYNFSRVDTTLILVVRNVTMRSGGNVRCVIEPQGPEYNTERRVLQRFLLLPLITHRSEVFAAPDPLAVTATEGEAVAVPFSIRLPVPEDVFFGLRNHLLWVHNGRVVEGPWEAAYRSLVPRTKGPRDVEPYYLGGSVNSPGQLEHVRLYFRAVRLADEGYVQCWFRPHQYLHEWVVQTTTLLVSPKNSTQ